MLPPSLAKRFASTRLLPERLPDDPFPMFVEWYNDAQERKAQPNPNAMTIATVDPDGAPSARIVLCRGIDVERGYVRFYTNYHGRKGEALERHPVAALLFHWDDSDQQVRIEGPAIKAPTHESDSYFATRPWESRLSAWASDQSRPLTSHEHLLEQAEEAMAKLGITVQDVETKGNAVHIPRPPHWGGFRIWAQRVELWLGGPGRFHDRARWTRTLTPGSASDPERAFAAGPWLAQRLQP